MKASVATTKKATVRKKRTAAAGKKNRPYREPTPLQLEKAIKAGIKKAAEETMRVMGYNVIAKDGWVVKVFADGREEKMTKLPYIKKPTAEQLAKFDA